MPELLVTCRAVGRVTATPVHSTAHGKPICRLELDARDAGPLVVMLNGRHSDRALAVKKDDIIAVEGRVSLVDWRRGGGPAREFRIVDVTEFDPCP
jgi:hypothetical protein